MTAPGENVERLIHLLERLDEWNTLTHAQQQAELKAGKGIMLSAKDQAALLEVVLGLVRRVS